MKSHKTRQVVLLRVGIDSGSGGMQGPLFQDNSFEFICIPDGERKVGVHKYGTMTGRNGKSLLDYFPDSWRTHMAHQHVHLDPEFETFTYGDPTPPKRSLRWLEPGDFLAFYCGLQEWDPRTGFNYNSRPGLYLVGYFEISQVVRARDFTRTQLLKDFGNNHHVRYRSVFKNDRKHLILIKGGPGSRLFERAYRISSDGRNRLRKPLKVLSPEMRKVFGTFGGRNSIERSPPRWVDDAFVDKAIRYLESRK